MRGLGSGGEGAIPVAHAAAQWHVGPRAHEEGVKRSGEITAAVVGEVAGSCDVVFELGIDTTIYRTTLVV